MNQFTLHLGDCLESLRAMPDNSVDSIVTDPPYGLSFMGKKWDYDVPGVDVWAECLRVLKPGGHLLAFAGTRTQHRMAVRIEDAGFEIRDMIAWVYGSGFPKSLDVSKAIDKAAGVEREVVGYDASRARPNRVGKVMGEVEYDRSDNGATITAPATDAAKQWQGWGTALKPALEPITVARKPLIGTVADNALAHGTGALNIDGCRVEFQGDADKASAKPGGKTTAKSGSLAGKTQDGFVVTGPFVDGERLYWSNETGWGSREGATIFNDEDAMDPTEATGREPATQRTEFVSVQGAGRWPANLIHDGSDEVLAGFPVTGPSQGGKHSGRKGTRDDVGDYGFERVEINRPTDDGGSAARFFYCAKASRADRNEGMTDPGPQFKHGTTLRDVENTATAGNNHPTVKPTDLMAYLCRLVTPPGGTVLDPFMGSGSTGKAAMREGFDFIGCELSPEYLAIARARIEQARVNENQPKALQLGLL
jgi:DNA modification methylase